MDDLLLALAFVAFGAGLRSFEHPVARKLGGISFVAAFAFGLHALTANWTFSIAFAIGWPLLIHPWLAIITQVRPLRLPLHKTLQLKSPPSEEDFPPLGEITGEIEIAGFEHVRDTGWGWQGFNQFFRLFYHEETRTQAWICVNQVQEMSMSYVMIVSRLPDGRTWLTTNDYWTSTSDVFSYGMVSNPKWRIRRFVQARSFEELLEEHRRILQQDGVTHEQIAPVDSSEMLEEIEKDLQRQLRHNLDIGLLTKATENEVRYSLKGMLFLWGQALRDILRLT